MPVWRRRHELEHGLSRPRRERLHVAWPGRALNGCLSFHSGCFGASALTRSSSEDELEVDRLLAPQRAVVVEHRDALLGRHEVGRALRRHVGDELEDRLLRGAVVPRRQRAAPAARRRRWRRRVPAADRRRANEGLGIDQSCAAFQKISVPVAMTVLVLFRRFLAFHRGHPAERERERRLVANLVS